MLTKQTTLSRPWIVMYPVDSAIHRINHYPVERWIVVYPVDSAIHLLNNRGLYFIRFGLDRLMKRAFREHPQEFVDYHHLELVDQLFGYVYAFVVLMMSMKFPRLFRFNRRIHIEMRCEGTPPFRNHFRTGFCRILASLLLGVLARAV